MISPTDMPDEIWVQIFRHLDPRDIDQAGRVCKKWKSIADEKSLWKIKAGELGLHPSDTSDFKQVVIDHIKPRKTVATAQKIEVVRTNWMGDNCNYLVDKGSLSSREVWY